MARTDDPILKLQCPKCQSRLDVSETSSGARTVSVAMLGPSVEQHANALEVFQTADAGPRVTCPACSASFDSSEPHRPIPPLKRSVLRT